MDSFISVVAALDEGERLEVGRVGNEGVLAPPWALESMRFRCTPWVRGRSGIANECRGLPPSA